MSSTGAIGEVVGFWRDAGPESWFANDRAFDAVFRDRFLDLHMAAARRELEAFMETAEGALALAILLDQFPRNAFRGTGHMFATDGLALRYAREALAAGHHPRLAPELRHFLCLPFEHSENLEDQELSVRLHAGVGEDAERWAIIHRDVVARFGRFPHRNPLLGRETTEDERRFLDEGGFAG